MDRSIAVICTYQCYASPSLPNQAIVGQILACNQSLEKEITGDLEV